MRRRVVLDVLRITLTIRSDLDAKEANAIRRTLDGRRFNDRLRTTVRGAFRAFPTLRCFPLKLIGARLSAWYTGSSANRWQKPTEREMDSTKGLLARKEPWKGFSLASDHA